VVWVGGGSDAAVQRAARWGDGWSPFFDAPTLSANNRGIPSVAQLGEKIKALKALRGSTGKSGRFDFVVGSRTVAKNRTRAEAEQMLQELGELKEVGVTWTFVYLGEADRTRYLENVRWFGEEVAARA
jgi:alkanesulfonate monooxygenase SsuD/methylene tetrahydromethanopterin reductase-like flavin-dependent oxidoreductase (luciferase family)